VAGNTGRTPIVRRTIAAHPAFFAFHSPIPAVRRSLLE